MKITYYISEQAIENEFITNGKLVQNPMVREYAPEDLTPEERKYLAPFTSKFGTDLTSPKASPVSSEISYKLRRDIFTASVDYPIIAIRQYIEARKSDKANTRLQEERHIKDGQDIPFDPITPEGKAHNRRKGEETRAANEKRKEEAKEAKARAAERKEAENEANDKKVGYLREWGLEKGSPLLKKRVEGGYNWKPLAGIEFLGYTLGMDFTINSGGYEFTTQPSEKWMDEETKTKKLLPDWMEVSLLTSYDDEAMEVSFFLDQEEYEFVTKG